MLARDWGPTDAGGITHLMEAGHPEEKELDIRC